MYNILSCFILSYILIYFCRLLYTLLYTTQPRIFYTTLIYSFIYLLYPLPLIYSLLYILSLLFSNRITNLASPFLHLFSYTYPFLYTLLLYTILSYILLYTYPSYFHILSTLMLLYPLSYIERV